MLTVMATILIILATIQAIELVFAYHFATRGAWKRSEMGRHLMVYMGAIATVLLLAATGNIADNVFGYEDPEWFRALRIVVFMSIPAVFLRQRWLLFKAQREPPSKSEGNEVKER